MKNFLCLALLAFSVLPAAKAHADQATPDSVIAEIGLIHAKLFAVDFRTLKPEDAKSYVEVLGSLENLKRSVAELAAPSAAPASEFMVYENNVTWRFNNTVEACDVLLAKSASVPSRVENFAEDKIRDCYRVGKVGCEISRPARIARIVKDDASDPYSRTCTVALDVVIKRNR
ncbi:MAG: hypothetical protein EOP11_19380 [Proteobacteria bacterium]|nr:MAG: hypothetical protein EOP11_19380 [Pseudomonadota bacterium]